MSTNNLIGNSTSSASTPSNHTSSLLTNASTTTTATTNTNVALPTISPSGSGSGGQLGFVQKVNSVIAGGNRTVVTVPTVLGTSVARKSGFVYGGAVNNVNAGTASTPNNTGGGNGGGSSLVPVGGNSNTTNNSGAPPTFVVGGNSGGSGGGGNKPQSQMSVKNKCLNEKRRREQENIYIEELAELISASIEDMSSLSVKPDKCAILQETVNQIRRIKASEECVASSSSNTASSSAQVQQGEVSSSTNILANEILCPLVLEALDGFLFVVNGDGIVEFVSDNVHGFINFIPVELIGKSIYNVIHLADHARFSSSLLPMSIAGWNNTPQPQSNTQTDSSDQPPTKHQRTFNIRVLVKSDSQTQADTAETSSTSHFENMQITAMLMPPSGTPSSNSTPERSSAASTSAAASLDTRLVCIARRLPPNERAPGLPVEQFTTKIRPDGHIIGLDTSNLAPNWSQFLKKENIVNNMLLQELAHHQDIGKLTSHLMETCKQGSSTSAVYRMKFGDKLVMVQTKSKVFAFNPNTEPDFIMATHTIIHNENDSPPPPLPSSVQGPTTPLTPQPPLTPNSRATPTPTTSSQIPSSPVMIIKKQPPTPTSSSSTPLTPMLSPHPSLHHQDSNNNENNHLMSQPSPQQQQQQQPPTTSSNSAFQTLTLQSSADYDFNLDFNWSDLDLDSNFNEPTPQASAQPTTVSLPRTSQPIASPAAPNLAATWGVSNSPLSTSSNSPFSNAGGNVGDESIGAQQIQQQQHQQQHQQQQQQQQAPVPAQQQQNQNTIGSDRLRNLLTLNQIKTQNDNRILKTLLNAADEHEDQPNNMLLKLLNNNGSGSSAVPASDEPMRRGTELLQQLLHEDTGSPNQGVKRTFPQMMGQQPVLLPPPPPKGDLCKRNPRLVSLLQKPSEPPATVPLVPPSYLSMTPNEKMNKIRAQQAQQQQSQLPAATTAQQQQQQQQQNSAQFQQTRNNLLNNLLRNAPVSPHATTSAPTTPSPSPMVNSPQSNQPVSVGQLLGSERVIVSGGGQGVQAQLAIESSDPTLDEILDQVIDIVPEDLKLLSGELPGTSGSHGASATLLMGNQNQILQGTSSGNSGNLYSDDVSNILNLLESNAELPTSLLTPSTTSALNSPTTPTTPHTPSDIAKIDAIQKELMQFETIQQITTTFHNQAAAAAAAAAAQAAAQTASPQPQQLPPHSSPSPLLIQRTTTSTMVTRFRTPTAPPNQIAPNHAHQQQLLKQQMLRQQQQRIIQQPALIQQLQQELKNRSGNVNTTVNLQNLDSLLSGNVPPPNVTLTSNGGQTAVFERVVAGNMQQQQGQQSQLGGTVLGNLVGTNNVVVQQIQQNQALGNIVIGGVQQQQQQGGIGAQGSPNQPQQQNVKTLQQLQQQLQQHHQLLRLSIQQQQLQQQQQQHQQQQQLHPQQQQQQHYNPINSIQSNQLNQRIVTMNNQPTQAWVNQNKARISIQQQNPMLNAQLGATVVSASGGAGGAVQIQSSAGGQVQQQQLNAATLQQQLLLRQQNFQQQQNFMFQSRVRSPAGVQQVVSSNQQQLLVQQQNLNILQQQLPTTVVNSQAMLQQPQQIITSGPAGASPIDVRPGLRAVVGARSLGAQLLQIPHSASPVVVVSSAGGVTTSVSSSSVPDLDALLSGNGGSGGGGTGGNANGAGGSVVQKVTI